MENFVVSARKYRPATFDSVIGQEHVTQTLKNAIRNNQLAHAFLFCGPRGVGKTTCARILAKTINCIQITGNTEACNECDSCRAFNANASFNIYELDAASNNSVDDIRGLVEQVRYAPQGAKYKIYIIDEVHMLSASAFNAFLKTLEEPPPYAKFILATTERHKILPTILSRCQVFDFHRINIESAVTQLKKITASEGIEADEEALHIIAQKADGAMRDALSIFDRIVSFSGKQITYKDVIMNLNILDYEYYFRAVDSMLTSDLPPLFLLFDEVLANGFDAQHFLSGFSEHIRNLLMCKYPDTVRLMEVAPALAKRFMQQASEAQASLLMNAMNLLNKCELEYKSSKNSRLHVELTLLKLCHIQSVIDLKSEASGSKKKIPDLTGDPIAETKQVEIRVAVNTQQVIKQDIPEPTRPLPPPLFKAAGNGSVQDQLEKLRQGNIETEETAVETPAESLAIAEEEMMLTEISFKNVWQQYIVLLNQQGKMSLHATYKDAAIQLLTEDQAELVLASQHEREMFEEDRIHVIPFLRGKLKRRTLDIVVKVNEQKRAQRIFTAEEKFKAMAERNPALVELRNVLGLELEY